MVTDRLPRIGLKKRLGVLGIGLLANQAIVWGFDLVLYPAVIYKFGILRGGLIMTILSFLVCYGSILFYDWAKQDWLGIETLKGVRESNATTLIGKAVAWLLKKGDIGAMLFCSIKFDPFITVAYMRHGAYQYNGLSKRDWRIFIASLIIGNAYWTAVAYTGIKIVEILWEFLRP